MTNRVMLWRGFRLGLLGAFCLPLFAPNLPAFAQEVVQPMRPEASGRLNNALQRLSRNPQSIPALLDAGRASLELDDHEAADGFFTRALGVEAGNGAAIAGLAVVALRREDPVQALELFDVAGDAGEDLAPYGADHGLAYDLVGDHARAQDFYGRALAHNESPETVRRMALSYAISGDRAASEAILLPLLQRRDLAAYRTRAFALAILGQEEEAVTIAETMLPTRLARRMAPYLRYMPRLTSAQQAAAANLGRFPAAADIGREDPQLVRRVNPVPRPAAAEEPAVTEQTPRPAFTLDDLPAADAPSNQQTAPQRGDLLDAFADFSLEAEDGPPDPAPGAVDITSFEPDREEPLPPPQPAHPSRHWVQVATGQNTSAFRFDWRRIVRGAGGLLDGFEPHRVRWNRTNRLVTGPFDTADEAQALVSQLRAEGVSTFRFTSAEGEQVSPLD